MAVAAAAAAGHLYSALCFLLWTLFIQSAPVPAAVYFGVLCFFEQSISDIALFSWDRVIFSHWPGNITQPLNGIMVPSPLHHRLSPTPTPTTNDLNKRIQLNQTWNTVAFNWKGIILYMISETISGEVVVLFNNSPIRHLSLKWKLPPKEMPRIRA